MTATSVTTLKKNIAFTLLCCTVLMMFVAGSTAASAQSCPTSPNYSPDFTGASSSACLTLNGSASFPTPAGSPATITAGSGSGGFVTFTAANSFTASEPIILSGFTASTNLNGLVVPVLSAGLSTSTFEIASNFTGSTGAGTATPVNALQLTPNANNQAGSAWYKTTQPVAGAFSTTFTFQLSETNSVQYGNADGIAFVIQNSPANPTTPPGGGTSALGDNGCGIGFGDDQTGGCTPTTGGIPSSLAVVFKTYNDGYPEYYPNTANSVSILSNGALANCINAACIIAVNNSLPGGIIMADSNVHSVTITYSGSGTKRLDVILDGNDLFPGGVVFDMTTLSLASGTNAWVGFTAATGGGDDNQDILSWTFSPGAQTIVASLNTPAVASFPNAAGNNVYDFTGQLTQPYPTPVIQIQPILMTQAACDALVQVNFWPARCFVYENAENSGLDASVMFAVTCPDSPGETCGSAAEQNFFATLGTDFQFLQSENPLFTYPGVDLLLNPFPGFLKGVGPNPLFPCTPPASGPLFQSNQVASFYIDGGHTNANSGGGASCWVATYDTPGEIWPGIKISSPTSTTYSLNQPVTAKYTCSNPSTSQPASSATGPYLTVDPSLKGTACTQSTGKQTSCTYTSVVGHGNTGGLACTGSVNTSTKGLHTFVVTAIDSGGNQNLNAVIYNVK
jgi:hypothetical protein